MMLLIPFYTYVFHETDIAESSVTAMLICMEAGYFKYSRP